jgi:3-oxoacyl-[acyl-carrier protein] reductase
MRLRDKVAIVTGGGSGFGAGIARRFAAEGAKLVVNDINAEGGSRIAQEVKGEFVQADVAKGADWAKLVQAATAKFGRLDIVVNNAGWTHRRKPYLEVTEAEFDKVYAVNVKSIYLSALHALPAMKRQGGGCFVNIASTAGLRPRPGLTVYNASKGAAITLTKSMAVEFAPDRIRVNCLCPVAGETPLLAEFMGADTPENRAKFVASIPLGRLSQSLDIANAALFLASDEAEFLTGVALEVDGGRCV